MTVWLEPAAGAGRKSYLGACLSGPWSAAQLAGTNVAPAEPLRPVDPVNRGVGTVAGGRAIVAACGDAEHAAAIGEEPLPVAAGRGVEDLDRGIVRRTIEAADL